MSQNSTTVGNGTGLQVRTALNAAVNTLETNHSGPSEPTTKYAYMLWADTTINLLKIRNGANDAWITIGTFTLDHLGLAQVASLQTSAYIIGTSSTGNDSYVVAISPAPTFQNGLAIELWADVGNTGACSLNANSTGDRAIKKNVNGSLVDTNTGDIVAGYPALLRFVTGPNVFLLINPMVPTVPVLESYKVGDVYFTTHEYANPAAVAAAQGYGTWAVWGTGRMPVVFDAGQTEFNAVEKTGGAKIKDISHTHSTPDHSHGLTGTCYVAAGDGYILPSNTTTSGGSTSDSGGGAPSILNPYIVLFAWKRTA